MRGALALLAGLLTHGSFLAAVLAMAVTFWEGPVLAQGTCSGGAALCADLRLVLQFPLLHSLLLTLRGRALLAGPGPSAWGRTLAPSTYALVASWQLLATFLLWSPSGVLWWRAEGAWTWLCALLFGGAWLFLGLSLSAAGPGLQTGWIGWTALLHRRAPRFPGMPTTGPFAVCRQPIYLGFALTLWTGATWTPDRLLLALAWSAYCVLGPLHKEARFRRAYGDAWGAYAARVPYIVPPPGPGVRSLRSGR